MIRFDKLKEIRKAAALNDKAGDWVTPPVHPPVVELTAKEMRQLLDRDRDD